MRTPTTIPQRVSLCRACLAPISYASLDIGDLCTYVSLSRAPNLSHLAIHVASQYTYNNGKCARAIVHPSRVDQLLRKSRDRAINTIIRRLTSRHTIPFAHLGHHASIPRRITNELVNAGDHISPSIVVRRHMGGSAVRFCVSANYQQK